jgi:hypothetical protein
MILRLPIHWNTGKGSGEDEMHTVGKGVLGYGYGSVIKMRARGQPNLVY